MNFDSTIGKKITKLKPDAAGTKINKLHKEVCTGMRTTLEKAIEVGKLLIAQKKKCGHGNWLLWIKSNLEFAERTAQQYINCHKNQAKLKAYPDTDLTLVELARIADEEEPKAIVTELVEEPVQEPVRIEGTYAQPVVHGGKPLPLMTNYHPKKYLIAACERAKEYNVTGKELVEMLTEMLPTYNL